MVGVKMTPTLRERLTKAAKANGRSVSQEAEARLAASLDRSGKKAFGVDDTDRLMRDLSSAVENVQKALGTKEAKRGKRKKAQTPKR